MLTAARERGVIGGREIDAQHPEDRGQDALGLTQRSVEDETERQGGFDGEIEILELPAPPADASRCPRGDRVRREPEGDVASPHEGSVVLGPGPDAIRCRVLRMHSRLHIEIMTRRRSRWSTCRPLLAHRAESAHQRPHRGARRDVGHRHGGQRDGRRGGGLRLVAVDHCATACIGLHAAKRGNRFEALEPIRQGIRERFGGIGEGVARGLRLRHDHGSNYLADDFQQEVAFFGIESSPSFVREPEGNGVAERFIRTLKENLLWVRSFATIEDLRLALLAFKRTYNEQWMLEKYDYRSPAQVRRDLLGLDAAA